MELSQSQRRRAEQSVCSGVVCSGGVSAAETTMQTANEHSNTKLVDGWQRQTSIAVERAW